MRFLAIALIGVLSFSGVFAHTETLKYKIDFGLLPVSASRKLIFRLNNPYASTMSEISWKKAGDSFLIESNCSMKLAPGAYCDFVIEFWAYRSGYAEGLLQIVTSKENLQIELSGYGNQTPEFPFPIPRPEPRP